jgi:soluble lytic murein transglycosylase-like protein
MTSTSAFRYILLAIALAAVMLNEDKQPVKAVAYYPIIAVAKPSPLEGKPLAIPVSRSAPKVSVLLPVAVSLSKQYRAVPEEDPNVITWVDPRQTKEKQTFRWKPIIDDILADGDYPNVDYMLILGMIAQETGGYNDAECNDFDAERGNCAVGLMAIGVKPWTGTYKQLKTPSYNIRIGISIINTIYDQAIEHDFKPGREATRAALAAYNCGWPSVLANKCFSFGGFTYSDKIDYWIYHLTLYKFGEIK